MTAQQTAVQYPGKASALVIVGGALMIVSGLLILAVSLIILPGISSFLGSNLHFVTSGNVTTAYLNGTTFTFTGHPGAFNGTFPFRGFVPGFVSGLVGFAGAVGLVSGIIVLVSGAMLHIKPNQRSLLGVLVIVFSVISFFGSGGFVVGAILGIVGGALALTWKPSA